MTRTFVLYYGWPTAVNGAAGDVATAVAELSKFDRVVLGEANVLSTSDPRGPDVVSMLASRGVQVLGYANVGLAGVETSRAMGKLAEQFAAWARLGARGVLLDCAGRDFGVTPRRFRAAVHRAHDTGLDVVANAWEPGDVLGEPSPLGPGDGYLAESWVVRDGAAMAPSAYAGKVALVEEARASLGVEISLSSTVLEVAGVRSACGAAIAGWTSCGGKPPEWMAVGDPLYGATDNRVAPLRSTWLVPAREQSLPHRAATARSGGRAAQRGSPQPARRRR